MICQHCGHEHAATQPSCPVCGSVPSPRASQGRPGVMPSGQAVRWTPSLPTRVTLSPAQTPLTTLREAPVLASDVTLQGKHYLLVERQELQQWSPEVYEARWRAQDLESGREVIVGEVALPLGGSDLQRFFRSATRALLRSSDLLNVFLEQGRGFFVFAPPVGESLQARILQRRLLSEQEATRCYGQIAEALLFFSQQHPPLVHGSIQPDHLIHVGSRWVLTHGSLLLAGGATQFLPQHHATPGSAHADLSVLAAVIYYGLTGAVPPSERSEQQAGLQNTTLSAAFAAVLLKGIHPRREARYQSPSEVLEALGRRTEMHKGSRQHRRSVALDRVEQRPSGTQPQQRKVAVPAVPSPPPAQPPRHPSPPPGWTRLPGAEDLPPFPPGQDRLTALLWTASILLGAMSILLMAR